MEEMDNFKKITPKLSEIKKANPFVVPPRYFDDFSARLQVKIEAEKTIHYSPRSRVIKFLKPALAAAACLAVIFSVGYFTLKTYNNEQLAVNANQNIELTDDNYISLLEGIDDNSFYALLSEPVISNEYSNEELISYLSSVVSDYDIYMEIDF